MITIDGGTGLIMNNGVELASEKMVDEWRVHTSKEHGSGVVAVTEYWERNDNNFALIGKSMTESSGVFSFPITGLFLIRAQINFYTNGGARAYLGCIIEGTYDNSTYVDIGGNYASSSGTNYYNGVSATCVFDVTDTSTHKVRLKTNFPGTATVQGSSNYQRTAIHFTRLGNT